MIEAHTIDAWTRPADRTTLAFRDATIVGGFAAPLFLWLAGVSLVLSAESVARRQGSRAAAVEAVCRRGLEVFILAFLFRLQAFIVSPGGHPLTLFRVDILNIMGPAIVVAGVVWGLGTTPRMLVASYAAIAASVGMLTPIVRTADSLARLPLWVQWYLRPAGEQTTFTAFPWVGFVFAGAAVGVLIANAGRREETRLHGALACAGAAIVTLGFCTASLPTIYRQSSFWTSSPTYFAIRVGTLTLLLPVVYALAELAARRGLQLRPLERLGRRSLFVYWIHVELVYGYATWMLHGRLPLLGTLAAYVAFSVLMYGAVVFRDRAVTRWRERRAQAPAEQTLTA
jgi:uncharacterized membrane protein